MSKPFYRAKNPEEALRIYIDGENEYYARIKNQTIKGTVEKIFGKSFPKSFKILEIGSGGGFWTDYFLKAGADVTCVDICENVTIGNKQSHPLAKIIIADAATVRIDEKFDLVFVKDVIEHIENDKLFLKNMRNHLKENGMIVINTQNSCSLNYLLQGTWNRIIKGNHFWLGWDPTHVRFYNKQTLAGKLVKSGFMPITWFGSYYFPYRVIEGRLGIKKLNGLFCIIEKTGLYQYFPLNGFGWNIGVVARVLK